MWSFPSHLKNNSLFSFLFLIIHRILLSVPKALLLEQALNTHDITQLSSLLTDLRQQALFHLLFRTGGTWRERKRIDRAGNYVYLNMNRLRNRY